jgi:hypothetical protein
MPLRALLLSENEVGALLHRKSRKNANIIWTTFLKYYIITVGFLSEKRDGHVFV